MSFRNKLYINGLWRDASDGAEFDVLNPADETVLTRVASGSVDDAKAAISAASFAASEWAARLPRERSEILRRAYELFIDRLEEFIHLISLENGKSYADSRSEALYAAEFFRWYSEEAVRIDGNFTNSPTTGAKTLVHSRPVGIALLITPWNYPAAMGTRKIGPALAAGCTILIKPASETPLTMLAIACLLADAGVPPGVVNVIPTQNTETVVDTILSDPRIRVISFTGSTQVGRILLTLAARNITNSAMELGGNAPFLVLEDADIDAAVDGLMIAKLRNIGEACTAANRIYVHDKLHDIFVDRLLNKMHALKVGPGLDRSVDIGPLISHSARTKVHAFVEDAVRRGAKIVLGGYLPEGKGFFYPPTIITDVPHDADCVSKEIFGPLAAIQRFQSETDIVAKANDTEYGLVAYVFTKDTARGMRICEKLDYGMIGLNRGIVSDPAAPFGGMKQSGIGREGAADGIEEFMEKQYISTIW